MRFHLKLQYVWHFKTNSRWPLLHYIYKVMWCGKMDQPWFLAWQPTLASHGRVSAYWGRGCAFMTIPEQRCHSTHIQWPNSIRKAQQTKPVCREAVFTNFKIWNTMSSWMGTELCLLEWHLYLYKWCIYLSVLFPTLFHQLKLKINLITWNLKIW